MVDAGQAGVAERLGIEPKLLVQERGWDEDVDHDLESALEERYGARLLAEGSGDVMDVILLWWREDGGDLVDELLDAVLWLAQDGVVWMFTPKAGRVGYVEPSVIADAARSVGLRVADVINVGADWAGSRLDPGWVGSQE
ncbi:DUF3052 domain-containing protein [Streptantibioticus ferralitis]|uniref:DUF3052 domain-containing protein n=1 Tax=Streptantibioticus ferralitis TaxID=236510 RepID=A0ABT5YUV3_9ACTN|nr:DUF3052 domain-containing protein [Streptantibioticus ferralitis]MDF2255204.1 DUF3052 domain-containing protein [Streptantibioticus ferralitis]